MTSQPVLSEEYACYGIPRVPDVAALIFFERVSAALLLAVFFPALIVLAVLIFLMSGQAPLIADRRVGRNGRLFWMFKLRTMWPVTGAKTRAKTGATTRSYRFIEYLSVPGERLRKSSNDPRVTSKLAAFCRRHSIDELLQLWHVIRGEMSFVGPRPLTASELSQHYGIDAGEVLSLRPGLSGLWQVTGRSRLSYSQRRRLDLHLVRNFSVPLYFSILRRTVGCVLVGDSAW